MSYYNEFGGEGGPGPGPDEIYPNPEGYEYEEEEEIPTTIVPPDTDSTKYPPPEDELPPYMPPPSTAKYPDEYIGEFYDEEYPEEAEYDDQEYIGEVREYEALEQPISPQAKTTPSGQIDQEQPTTEATPAAPALMPCGGEVPDGLSEDDKLKARLLESFCCQQVQIPPSLPNILKAFTKSAIRTQPRNLEQWAAAYFRAMANGETPPVKDRLEYPAIQADNGLTRGYLRVLNKQLGDKREVPFDLLREKWKAICLEPTELSKLLDVNEINGDIISWNKFIVCASASIAREDVGETMSIICQVLTRQPDGVDPYINYDLWFELYTYEAQRSEISMDIVENLDSFLKGLAASNFNQIGPKDFLHQNCPPIV